MLHLPSGFGVPVWLLLFDQLRWGVLLFVVLTPLLLGAGPWLLPRSRARAHRPAGRIVRAPRVAPARCAHRRLRRIV